MFITETWLKPQGDEAACVDVTPGGYSMRSFPRQARRGGGIAFITRNSLFEHATVTTEFPFDHNSFELVQLTLDGHHRVNFFCLYRPPPSKVNKLTDGMFFEEFSELLEHANVMGGKTLFLGDFNISWDRPAHPNTVKAVDLLDMFSLSQAVNFPTHRDGHTIDWCVFREEELILRSVSRGPSLTSDHMPVMCYLDIAKPASTPVFQTVRNLRAIDKSQFRADVAAVFHNQPPATVEQLEAHLRAVLDVHAPAIRRLQTQRRSSPCKMTKGMCQLLLAVVCALGAGRTFPQVSGNPAGANVVGLELEPLGGARHRARRNVFPGTGMPCLTVTFLTEMKDRFRDRIDPNDDGKATVSEVRQYLSNFNPQVTPDQVNSFITRRDLNGQ
ncbi:hypothetical protein ACOMHN_025600 [Nucella lapillus]